MTLPDAILVPDELAVLQADDEAAALERLHALGCTDGLPVVIPTGDRVARMALASGLDPTLSLGLMGPALAECTIGLLATSAVMAGCLPDHMPVVVAAATAVLDPRFDLTEMQATTHATTPLVIVNGPARTAAGVHGGFGALGPGHRANASIGRALRLAMINIGGGRSGSSDMALLGHGGKFTMCLAEDEEASPWEPMHVALGHDVADSTVTVIGADAPTSVIGSGQAGTTEYAERLLTSLASAFSSIGTNNAAIRGGQAALALNPDHANALAAVGLDRADVQRELADRAIVPAAVIDAAAGPTPSGGRDRRCFVEPTDVLVFVAGGTGLYSAAFTTWSTGPHRNRAVTASIVLDQACEIPGIANAAASAVSG